MSFNPFAINLAGIEPLGAARGDLPDGGIRVRTGVASLKRGVSDPTQTNLVIPVVITGEGAELDGSERDVYLTLPNGKDEENDKFFARKIAGFLRSIGQNTNGTLNISPELISNKQTHIQVSHKADSEGKQNENIRFITAEEYQRAHWRKKLGSTTNGKSEAVPLTAPVPMAMAPVAAPQMAPQPVGVPASPAVAAAPQYAPQLAAPVGAPVAPNLGGFFNAPPQV